MVGNLPPKIFVPVNMYVRDPLFTYVDETFLGTFWVKKGEKKQKNVQNGHFWPLSPQKGTKMTKMEIFQNNVFKTPQEVQHSKKLGF